LKKDDKQEDKQENQKKKTNRKSERKKQRKNVSLLTEGNFQRKISLSTSVLQPTTLDEEK